MRNEKVIKTHLLISYFSVSYFLFKKDVSDHNRHDHT